MPATHAGADELPESEVLLGEREGDLFDGGAGVDTLVLGAGVSLPAGVTLTSIEFVVYG